MASSPVKFLFVFLMVSIIGWFIFTFFSRLLAWFMSRVLGASVGFRVAGCNCLRDVTMKFRKGSIESVSIGEIKLSLRKSLVKLGFSFISRDPKLHILICDLEIVTRSSEKKVRKTRQQRSHSGGKGKWMLLVNVARFLSVSITDLIVRVPKAIIEVKELGVDICKTGSSNPLLLIKLTLVPFLVHMGDVRPGCDHSSGSKEAGCLLTRQTSAGKNIVPFTCENLLVDCELGHEREVGIKLRSMDVKSGEVIMNLHDGLFVKSKTVPEISHNTDTGQSEVESLSLDSERSQKDVNSLISVKKSALQFPDKVTFSLPKVNARFVHSGHEIFVENHVMGIHLRSRKSPAYEDSEEATTHFDVQLDFSEIHLLRENSTSVLEILKLAVVASFDVPIQPAIPIRAEIDVKLGGTQCNLIMNRLKPWLQLHLSKKKHMTLPNEHRQTEKFRKSDIKLIMWTCTLSAPELNIVLYNLDGSALYQGCSQSSHLYANNIASKGIQVHMELGEIHLRRPDESEECLKENIFGVETNASSLMHIAKVSLDLGHKEMEASEESTSKKWKLVMSVDITGMGMFLNFQHVESLILTVFLFKSLLQSLSTSKKVSHKRSSKVNGKGLLLIKLNLERCSVNFSGDVGLEDTVVQDPKHVNFGSQGGKVVFTECPDGAPRIANILSTLSSAHKLLKFSTCLDILHLCLTVNKEKKSVQLEIERTRSIYQELSQEQILGYKVTLFDMQNAKLVRRTGGFNEISVCSLFSATDITLRWEPDAHLGLLDLVLRLKLLINNQKARVIENGFGLNYKKSSEANEEMVIDPIHSDKQHKKKESIFAVDIEMLRVSAEVGDGVETMVHVQSIFSENARIGILLEGLSLSLNEARVLKSSRMQISRIPISITNNLHDSKVNLATTWDWVVQGLDISICMPYRLQLRAIEDAIEDMLRCLKLVTTARKSLLFPSRKDAPKKVKGKSKFGTVRFNIKKITADIEEEPIQGWLDEHYHLMKNISCELAVRLKFLDDVVSEGKESKTERKIQHNGLSFDVDDVLATQKLQEEIHKQAFCSYYLACQNLSPSEGSGAYKTGFQAGFRPSAARSSLLSLSATDLDVTLTEIEEGDSGIVQFIKKVDPVALEHNIPFSRLYGRKLLLKTGSLVAQLRNYTFPLFAGYSGKCEGCVVLAQQATCFQPQIHQDVFIGRWRKVRMFRSASGTTPAMKMYSDLPIFFQNGEVSFGVGYEPSFADISYAFTVALRRANLSVRSNSSSIQNVSNMDSSMKSTIPAEGQPVKKERSLPWWDDVRYYIHGKISLCLTESRWNLLATTNPYEKIDKLQIVSGFMNIQQTDGRVVFSVNDFKVFISSLESLTSNCSLKLPPVASVPFIDSPAFILEVDMNWDCESGKPLNHYLHALPREQVPREKVYDPFRSTSLSLKWNFSLKPCFPVNHNVSAVLDNYVADEPCYVSSQNLDSIRSKFPTMNLGAHDLIWVFKFWNMNYNPPHKLRSFSRWPRFGIPRAVRSGNLSLDKVMTEFFLRLDSTPTLIKHLPLGDDDPACGLTFKVAKLKYESCYSRGKQHYTFECKRDTLDLVYQGLDLHLLKAYLNRDNDSDHHDKLLAKKVQEKLNNEKCSYKNASADKNKDDGFLLSSDYFTIRKQSPKADPESLTLWQESGRKNQEMTCVRSEFENESESDQTRSDPSDDDGFNVVVADNCQRVFVYGLKLLWTIENRDAVWSWVGGISKAFEPPKPSPSRQYVQRKLIEQKQLLDGSGLPQDDVLTSVDDTGCSIGSPSPQHHESGLHSPPPMSTQVDCATSVVGGKHGHVDDLDGEGTGHFMVNVIQPQFNLHSEEANGRFLLAAASGRVLARSFHSVLQVGYEMIEQLGTGNIHIQESKPEVNWKRAEFSVMLEHVQAHVAPTDVDPGAGLQWLPKILRSSPKLNRTGALLERVFMPCTMYFRYTRHKGGTSDLKVKPLKELSFNSPNITASMTSRQFQVMLDVLTNLLFARLPKPRKSSLSYAAEDDDVEEEADEVVPDGVEEVELAKINLEKRERERKLLLDDIRTLWTSGEISRDAGSSIESNNSLWMVSCGKTLLVHKLKIELGHIQKSRKAASAALRESLQNAAQLRLMEKEKNKSPSCAMRISMRINKVVWSMLADGKSFAEAEIISMIYDFARDYKDIGVAQFTTKSFFVRNGLPNAKSDMLLSAWNAPSDLGKNLMLRVDAKQGAPKDGNSLLEHFEVEIYPLKIYLTESMYRMMWGYFFPEEEQDSHRRQEVWKVSTAGSKRAKKNACGPDMVASSSHAARDVEFSTKSNATSMPSVTAGVNLLATQGDVPQTSKLQNLKANIVCGSNSELRRTSSFDRSLEENVTDSMLDELTSQAHSSKSGPLGLSSEHQHIVNDETHKSKQKESKTIKVGRLSHEEKKVGKPQDEKRARTRKLMEFHNIKISQVELLVTYEGSRFAVNELRLLMDTFHREDFTGTWRRLFSRVKKHIIWGVLKSVTGMQGKKFKHKALSQKEEGSGIVIPDGDMNFSDSDGGLPGKSDQFPIPLLKRSSDGAGEGFVTSVRGLFNSQRRRAKAFVLRTMRGEADTEFQGDLSESDGEAPPFARQLTITNAKKLLRRHTKKFRPKGQKGPGSTSQEPDSHPSSPKETSPFESDLSDESLDEDPHE